MVWGRAHPWTALSGLLTGNPNLSLHLRHSTETQLHPICKGSRMSTKYYQPHKWYIWICWQWHLVDNACMMQFNVSVYSICRCRARYCRACYQINFYRGVFLQAALGRLFRGWMRAVSGQEYQIHKWISVWDKPVLIQRFASLYFTVASTHCR